VKSRSYQTTSDYYSFYFEIIRRAGSSPMTLDETELKVTVVKKGFAWHHFTYNILRLCMYFILELLLLFRNYWTDFKYDTQGGKGYLFQIGFLTGISMGLSPSLLILQKTERLAKLFTDWLRFENTVDGRKQNIV